MEWHWNNKSVHNLPDSLMSSFLSCTFMVCTKEWIVERETRQNIYLVDVSEPGGIASSTTASTQRDPSVARTAQALCSRGILPWSQLGRSGK